MSQRALVNVLGEKVHYQEIPSSLFDAYFSTQQQEVVPACVVLPGSAQDVSQAIKVITQHECIFAVKSGGHAMFTGASNAPEGITIDLRNLNSLQISDDRKITAIGSGNRWLNVYDYLDPFNVTVVGGRDVDVGVGGFLLGGGISFISRRHGWGLDNVYNYELVLANGSISIIHRASNPDLYWALRGGGKNFGIVTRFDMFTHVDTEMWGGVNILLLDDMHDRLAILGIPRKFEWTTTALIGKTAEYINKLICKVGYCISVDDVASMLGEIALEAENDIFAHAWAVPIFFSSSQTYLISAEMNHGKGVEGAPGFGALHRAKKVYKTNRVARTADFAREITTLNTGGRCSYETATFKLDADLQKDIMHIYIEETEKIRHLKHLLSSIPMQIITKAEIAHFLKNGSNCLGLDPGDGPLLLLETAMLWTDPKDDATVLQTSKNILDRSIALAKERGLHHPFLYQNYAGKRQDVFGSYGEKNLARLRKIRDEYDPDHVFTRLSPGYFNV
ncbi:FAD-binding domain-containing protein [Mollisia scopiformis]|uniref:FAD-binding domain-containing protein n=1 Tax=Mollisia scopiformis TaxID=149040 RepID=A0A132B407_MOLSC|nr:FAD-binding domain-containing protein [Mollisia scopiformis]KUJ06654.1 FAD-binding domain-containing protein [Mollisia scopiformis]